MPGSYLLDTNAAIALLEDPRALDEQVAGSAMFYISLAVMGELYYGVENSARREANLDNVQSLLDSCSLLESDLGTAEIFGRIRFELRSKGKPIPMNDIWIAAIAQQYGLPVLTRDKHFREVDDLEVVGW